MNMLKLTTFRSHFEHNASSEQLLSNGALTDSALTSKPEMPLAVSDLVQPPAPDPNPAGPSPIEDVAPGQAPVADYIPKDAAPMSHPTPPPDEPLGTSEANVDIDMPLADDSTQPESDSAPLSAESSLVRPRDDDGDDFGEPAAKRSKVEEELVHADIAPENASTLAATVEMSEPEPQLSTAALQAEKLPESPVPVHASPAMPQRIETPPVASPPLASLSVEAQPIASPPAAHEAVVSPPVEPQPVTPLAIETQPIISQQVETTLIQPPPTQAEAADTLTASVAVVETPVDAPQLSIETVSTAVDVTPPVETVPIETVVTTSIEGPTTTDVDMRSPPEAQPTDVETTSPPEAKSIEANATSPLETKPTELDLTPAFETDPTETASNVIPALESKPTETDVKPSVEAAEIVQASAPLSESAALTPAATAAPTDAAAATAAAAASTSAQTAPTYSTESITTAQNKFLQEKMKNLKKTKNSIAFLNPVDPVTMGIPTYFDVIKTPMDLSTMETKLKNGAYNSVQDFADDFNLIITNTRRFNGDAHSVSQAGMAMEAYFRKMMETVPSADQPPPQKPQPKKMSPKPPPPRRESRSAAVATSPGGAANTFALQPDGTPLIRRDSTINRPTRTIKPPQNREIAYAKPKRKENQLELKFCDHILQQIRSPKYATVNHVFLAPVDPVALNIPHYRQVVKNPMDLGTMAQKLKGGQYAKASEFKKDFDLVISNCLQFNPAGHAVRDMGIQLQRAFEELWRGKEKWERGRKLDTQRASSGSAEEESEGEEDAEEEEEDEEPAGDQAAKIKTLQKQLIDMQNLFASLKKPAKTKKPKPAKNTTKNVGTNSAAPKQKAAAKPKPTKKAKQVTYEEKQEISEAVGKMNGAQVEELTRIITTNCKKYADQEEMELEIDDLPNDVQVMLLQYVRKIFGNPNKRARAASPDDVAAVDDDDFEPERGNKRGNKRKKHKPMGKKEQQDTISSLQAQLAQFQNVGASGSNSPTNSSFAQANRGAESSGDDESEESEEE